jgi:hypothetical protein
MVAAKDGCGFGLVRLVAVARVARHFWSLGVAGGIKFVPDFYDQVVQKEFLGRFGETMHRPQPFYFYWPHLLHKFAPWSVMLLIFAIVFVRVDREDRRERTGDSNSNSIWRRMAPATFWLVVWSLGGLIVMSIIPSKRVDRIFPVIPPLCLLLAAQAGGLVTREQSRRTIRICTACALVFAILFAGGYSALKVSSGYRDHRDALVQFGREVRQSAATDNWRYEVIETSDEGLLLYLDKMHFVRPEQALQDWAEGKINALVLPTDIQLPNVPMPPETNSFSPHSASRRLDGGRNYWFVHK